VQLHLTNPGATSVQVELKLGFRRPNGTPVNLFNQHLVISLPAGLDATVPLLNATWAPGSPTGDWTIEGTMLEPALGSVFGREVETFRAMP